MFANTKVSVTQNDRQWGEVYLFVAGGHPQQMLINSSNDVAAILN